MHCASIEVTIFDSIRVLQHNVLFTNIECKIGYDGEMPVSGGTVYIE